MELQTIQNDEAVNRVLRESLKLDTTSVVVSKPFIEANTQEVTANHLHDDCIIPVFAKDNERTISHTEFIDSAVAAANRIYSGSRITSPEIRVSHQIKGRTPDAIHKPVNQLLYHEKTIYYERMAFIMNVPEIMRTVNGNDLMLTIGGVRSYHQDNLFNKKSMERFKFFIGFQNMVCCNLCISTDGLSDDLRASSVDELQGKMMELIKQYNHDDHLLEMKELTEHTINEQQFAQLIGKWKLYNYLPKEKKANLPAMQFNESQLSSVAKNYFHDESFSRDERGLITMWNVYNLLTGANKSSYIDTFAARNVNAFDLAVGVTEALQTPFSRYSWFVE